MKRSLLVGAFLLFSTSFVFSQITITQSDFSAVNQIGTTFTSYVDSSGSLNIGAPGSNSWNFSALQQANMAQSTIVSPSGTPFESDFPGATSASFSTAQIQGATIETWTYSSLASDALRSLGIGSRNAFGNFSTEATTQNKPPRLLFELPFTLNSTWSSTDSIITTTTSNIPGVPPQILRAQATTTYTVDAFGQMTFPGGRTVDALRVRQDQVLVTSIVPGFNTRVRSVLYTFLAETGENVSLSTLDTLSTSGTLSGSVSFSAPGDATGVEEEEQLPTTFKLLQNYPNPFNPSTVISYTLQSASPVELRIFNFLGQEVRALEQANRTAGLHQVQWDGKDNSGTIVPSGVYIYRLSAGALTQSRKMLFLR